MAFTNRQHIDFPFKAASKSGRLSKRAKRGNSNTVCRGERETERCCAARQTKRECCVSEETESQTD